MNTSTRPRRRSASALCRSCNRRATTPAGVLSAAAELDRGRVAPLLMASLLLETKLFVPRRRRGLVARPRLSERLNRGAESKLMLVSAPAAFGKTALLTEWLDRLKYSAAWGSLDQADNHATSCWSYFIAA